MFLRNIQSCMSAWTQFLHHMEGHSPDENSPLHITPNAFYIYIPQTVCISRSLLLLSRQSCKSFALCRPFVVDKGEIIPQFKYPAHSARLIAYIARNTHGMLSRSAGPACAWGPFAVFSLRITREPITTNAEHIGHACAKYACYAA